MTCMIRFTSYLSKVGGSLRTLASHTTKTGHHNIAENCCTDIKPYERNKQLDSVFQEILLVCQQIWCTSLVISKIKTKKGSSLKIAKRSSDRKWNVPQIIYCLSLRYCTKHYYCIHVILIYVHVHLFKFQIYFINGGKRFVHAMHKNAICSLRWASDRGNAPLRIL